MIVIRFFFYTECMKCDMHVWIKTFFKPWSDLKWLALKVVLLRCSPWTCDHSWSIEDWIHSKRRYRLGQALVEQLVYCHTNLKLEQRLELYDSMRPVSSPGTLRWWLKSLCQTTRTDPPSVSESESESESDKDSD